MSGCGVSTCAFVVPVRLRSLYAVAGLLRVRITCASASSVVCSACGEYVCSGWGILCAVVAPSRVRWPCAIAGDSWRLRGGGWDNAGWASTFVVRVLTLAACSDYCCR
jgi:hypothetical protein